MKRSVGILAGVATLGVGVYLGARGWAQQPPVAQPTTQPPAVHTPPLRTRVALVNLATVIRIYSKAQNFQRQLIEDAKKLDHDRLEPLRLQITQKQAAFQKPDASQAVREQLERELRQLQLQLRNEEEDARKQMNTKQSDWTVQLYKEIEEMVKSYAKAYDIELVLFFSDPINPANAYDPAVIQNRLSMRAALPMYSAPGMDISEAIANELNRKIGGSPSPAAAAPPVTPTTTGSAAPPPAQPQYQPPPPAQPRAGQ